MENALFIMLCWLLLSSSCFCQPGRNIHKIKGCYAIHHASWPDSLERLSNPNNIPKQIKLTEQHFTVKIGKRGKEKIVRPKGYKHAFKVAAVDSATKYLPFNYWKIDDDSIFIGEYLAFTGFHLQLKQVQNNLKGKLTSFTDYIVKNKPSRANIDLTMTPIACK